MSDALERLRQRNRPTVPPRDASLTPGASIRAIAPLDSESLDTSISRYQDIQNSKLKDSRPQEIEPSLQTKQSTMRLEQELSDRLQAVCRDNGISREVLIEALFEYGEAHPEVMSSVLKEAQLKNEHRQQIANLKRAKSMMEKFGQ
jgi:hypothetical protein